MKIPHRDQTAWTRADLRAPTDEGYVLIALAPARPAVPTPLGRATASRGREALYQLGAELARRPDVLEAAQMRAVITAPGSARGSSEPRWKDVLLVRTRALPAALAVADQIDTASLPGNRKLVIAARFSPQTGLDREAAQPAYIGQSVMSDTSRIAADQVVLVCMPTLTTRPSVAR